MMEWYACKYKKTHGGTHRGHAGLDDWKYLGNRSVGTLRAHKVCFWNNVKPHKMIKGAGTCIKREGERGRKIKCYQELQKHKDTLMCRHKQMMVMEVYTTVPIPIQYTVYNLWVTYTIADKHYKRRLYLYSHAEHRQFYKRQFLTYCPTDTSVSPSDILLLYIKLWHPIIHTPKRVKVQLTFNINIDGALFTRLFPTGIFAHVLRACFGHFKNCGKALPLFLL